MENVEIGVGIAAPNVMPDYPLYVIYRAQNNTAMILQYVGSIEDQFNLEVIATDIDLDIVETCIRQIIKTKTFIFEGHNKAQAEYHPYTTYEMCNDGWKGEVD